MPSKSSDAQAPFERAQIAGAENLGKVALQAFWHPCASSPKTPHYQLWDIGAGDLLGFDSGTHLVAIRKEDVIVRALHNSLSRIIDGDWGDPYILAASAGKAQEKRSSPKPGMAE
jgi:hypothetical protein